MSVLFMQCGYRKTLIVMLANSESLIELSY